MFDAGATLAILQCGDSAYPAGGFAFSWGVEGLAADGCSSTTARRSTASSASISPAAGPRMDRPLLGEAFRASSCEEIAKVDRCADARDPSRADARRVAGARGARFSVCRRSLGGPLSIDLSRSRLRRTTRLAICPSSRRSPIARRGLSLAGGRAPLGLDAGQRPCQRGRPGSASSAISKRSESIRRPRRRSRDSSPSRSPRTLFPSSFTPLIDIAVSRGRLRPSRMFTT